MMTISQQVFELVSRKGMVRARDLSESGISPTHLQRLYEQGLVERSGRGVYYKTDLELDENSSLSEVALRAPAGIICLLSALKFHGLTTQLPSQVWIALPARAHNPNIDWPPVRFVHFSGDSLTLGVEEKSVGSIAVRVYSPAKTVADCFKFRNKIGLDVALEALREVLGKRMATVDELWNYAKICRVANVMRPYLESVSI